jgi:diaminohydroxyphosphoribosylaminopyrimidine deaminase/5-amino-6-(5-phosphoribosylamino)uracil reductase
MSQLSKYMQRALDLAGLGLGKVSPNPLVGGVVVYNGKIVGEGWHQRFGGPHAEVNAIESIDHPKALVGNTLFVNLEPCAHHGKTPPCTELIIKSGIKKVVIANTDPNPQVAGKGIEQLRESGIQVTEGVLGSEGEFLNRRFFCFHRYHRPYIILKWAETTNGFIAKADFDSKWISNEYSRQLVHQYRAQEDAVMVGRNTAHYDNPELTVRQWKGRNPIRIVLDPKLALDKGLKLFDGSVLTLCYNTLRDKEDANLEFIKAPKKRFIDFIWDDLYKRGIQSVMVEGGGKLLDSLIKENYWDEARVFTGSKEFGEGINAPVISTGHTEERIVSGDLLKTYYNPHASH